MLDRHIIPLIHQPLKAMSDRLASSSITANQVSVMGFLLGCISLPMIWSGHYLSGLLFILINRIFDGLDGAIARRNGCTDAGGFLDIALDFIFYSLIPFSFILANPEQNAIAGSLLIFSFVGTCCSFLSFASVAAKNNIDNIVYQNKSLYYMAGIAEGTETILFFVIICLLPQYFSELAYIFALICWLTTFNRIWSGFNTLKAVEIATKSDKNSTEGSTEDSNESNSKNNSERLSP